MIRRTRTTKTLAKRMDLQYFTRSTPFRRWRLLLSIAAPVLALVWILGQRATGHPQRPYSSGPLSSSHAVFTSQCNLCHVQQAGAFRQDVEDKACLGCHDAPLHTAKQSFTPECGSCHAEHKGSSRLARTADNVCTQCHADLRAHLRSGSTQVVSDIRGFDRAHPEFAPLRAGGGDPGRVKLNHHAHLQANLAGPHGPVQMQCNDCHRTADGAAAMQWPYPTPPAVKNASSSAASDAPIDRGSHDRAYMLPIKYADQCAGCHTRDLQFDKRFPQAVPHDKPQVVHEFLVAIYKQYIAAHPGALHEPQPLMYAVPARNPRQAEPVPHNNSEWVTYQVAGAERLLWNKGCKLCHEVQPGGAALPQIANSSIPARWLPHAQFDHDAHRMMSCESCHARTRDSRDTADVLLPGIATCRQCHLQQGARVEAAEGRCFECHEYHQWKDEKPVKGKFDIRQLRAGMPIVSPAFPGEAVPSR